MGGRQIEPFRAVDLRKTLHLSTVWRPLDFEGVAFYGVNVEVALNGESNDAFAATLTNLAKRLKRPHKSNARLLHELPEGGDACVLICIHFAFRDRP